MKKRASKPKTSKSKPSEDRRMTTLFSGKKSKWLPLYQRMLARFSNIQGIEFLPREQRIEIAQKNLEKPCLGEIRITPKGLEVGLGLASSMVRSERLSVPKRRLRGVTHRVLIAKASEMDEEFMAWVKSARHQARAARLQSNSQGASSTSS